MSTWDVVVVVVEAVVEAVVVVQIEAISRAVAHHPQPDINPADDSGEKIVDGAQENDQQAHQDDRAFNAVGIRAIDGASDHEDDPPARPDEDFLIQSWIVILIYQSTLMSTATLIDN